MENLKVVGKVNQVDLTIIENGNTFVPIKPICQALGIDFKTQYRKLSESVLFASTMGEKTTVASDGKAREMTCLPFDYALGWLFTINANKVDESARETLLAYQKECINALWNWFVGHKEFVEEKDLAIEQKLQEIETINKEFNSAKKKLEVAKSDLKVIRVKRYEEWLEEKKQTTIKFA